jgi:hypothetical protein
MKAIFKTKENLLLLFILLLAAILRFIDYYGWSLSNDELSALSRLRYDNLKDLVKYGVMTNDMHPAGVQVFLYYWVKLFGLGEASVRLPFVVAGIISVYITYLIAKKWFNKNTAILSAATLAVLQFPILYSQLARPYSPGLLFSLLTVLFFTDFLWESNRKRLFSYVGFVFSFVFAAYSHHYSFLFVVMVWLTGLFFLNRKNWLLYLSMPLAIFILYLPNLKVFIFQFFGVGGVGGSEGWLNKPGNDFFQNYLFYSLNGSWLFIGLLAAIFLTSVIISYRSVKFNKFQIISLLWFLLHFFIAFFYSRMRNPILQNSILLFSFPFLLMFIFSFIAENRMKFFYIALAAILLTGTYTTVVSNKYYSQKEFADFKSVAVKISEMNKKYGYQNITRTVNCTGPYYIQYFFDRASEKVDFVSYRNTGGEELLRLKDILKNSQTPYFLNAPISVDPPEVEDIIMTKYPYIVEQFQYTISKVTLYSIKKPDINISGPVPVYETKNSFEKSTDYGYDSAHIVKGISLTGSNSYLCDSSVEYGPGFRIKYSDINKDIKVRSYKISLGFYTDADISDVHLVIQVTPVKWQPFRPRTKLWHANLFRNFYEKGRWNMVFLNSDLPNDMTGTDEIAVYVWNPKREKFYIDDIKISFYKEKLFYPW